MSKPTVCLDFNGVLDTYTGWVKGGIGTEYPPRAGCAEFLQQLAEQFTVVICTAIDADEVLLWLARYGLMQYVDDVTNTKPAAAAYIDDRAICFNGSYEHVLEQLSTFKPYWQE